MRVLFLLGCCLPIISVSGQSQPYYLLPNGQMTMYDPQQPSEFLAQGGGGVPGAGGNTGAFDFNMINGGVGGSIPPHELIWDAGAGGTGGTVMDQLAFAGPGGGGGAAAAGNVGPIGQPGGGPLEQLYPDWAVVGTQGGGGGGQGAAAGGVGGPEWQVVAGGKGGQVDLLGGQAGGAGGQTSMGGGAQADPGMGGINGGAIEIITGGQGGGGGGQGGPGSQGGGANAVEVLLGGGGAGSQGGVGGGGGKGINNAGQPIVFLMVPYPLGAQGPGSAPGLGQAIGQLSGACQGQGCAGDPFSSMTDPLAAGGALMDPGNGGAPADAVPAVDVIDPNAVIQGDPGVTDPIGQEMVDPGIADPVAIEPIVSDKKSGGSYGQIKSYAKRKYSTPTYNKPKYGKPRRTYGSYGKSYGSSISITYGPPRTYSHRITYGKPKITYGKPRITYGKPIITYGKPRISYGIPPMKYGKSRPYMTRRRYSKPNSYGYKKKSRKGGY